MKKLIVLALGLLQSGIGLAETVTSVDVVKVIDGHVEETLYYYQSNWAKYRREALAQGFIAGYRLLVDRDSEDDTVVLLMTDYADREQYEAREEHFGPIMDAAGGPKLLNELEPGAFRQITDAWTFTAAAGRAD